MTRLLKTFIFAAILSCTTFLIGCQNTVEGFGKDMQNTGQEIQKSTQPKNN